jgi:hypothetical protein
MAFREPFTWTRSRDPFDADPDDPARGGRRDSTLARPHGGPPPGALAAGILALLLSLGCAKPTPTGALFGGPHPPRDGTARVYLYRVDTHHSFSTVEIRFDDEKPFPILDEEYATLELEDGVHEVEFRLRNAIWGGWRWRKQILRASPGETIYMEITVGVDEQPLASEGDLAIPGRDSGTAGESVSLRLREPRAALEPLSRTHRTDRARR